jgi:hypothetical protein
MTREKWVREARRWAKHAYSYEAMLDDIPEFFEAAFAHGDDPYETVDRFAVKYDLERADQNWGTNQNVPFEKELRA